MEVKTNYDIDEEVIFQGGIQVKIVGITIKRKDEKEFYFNYRVQTKEGSKFVVFENQITKAGARHPF